MNNHIDPRLSVDDQLPPFGVPVLLWARDNYQFVGLAQRDVHGTISFWDDQTCYRAGQITHWAPCLLAPGEYTDMHSAYYAGFAEGLRSASAAHKQLQETFDATYANWRAEAARVEYLSHRFAEFRAENGCEQRLTFRQTIDAKIAEKGQQDEKST